MGGLLVFLICMCVSFQPLVSGMTSVLGSNLVIQIIIFFCGILWILRAVLRGRLVYRSGKIAAAAAVFLLVCIIWTIIAPRKLPAVITLIAWVSDIILLLVIIQSADEDMPRTILTCLLASTAVAACIGITQYLWGLDELRSIIASDPERVKLQLGLTDRMWGTFMTRVNTNRAFGTFIYPNALAGFIDIVLPVTAGICLGAFVSLRKPVSGEAFLKSGIPSGITLAAILAVCLLFTFSKGGWAAAIIACIFLAGWHGTRKHLWWTIGVCAVAIALLAVFAGLGKIPAFHQYTDSMRVRFEYWESGLRMMRDNHFMGGGLRSFGDFYSAYKEPSYQEVKLAHSTVIQLLADMGIFGLISYAALWIFLIRGIADTNTKEDSPPSPPRAIGIWAGITAFILLAFARDISPFTNEMGAIDYGKWFWYMILWVISYLAIGRLIHIGRPAVRAGLAAGCVGYLAHGMVDFDMFVPGIHQTAFVAAACGCSIPVKKRPLKNTSKMFLLAGSLAAAAGMALWMHGLLPVPDLLAGDGFKTEGQYLAKEGKTDEAVAYLRKSVDANPLDDEVHATLSTAYLNMWRNGQTTFDGKNTRELAIDSALQAVHANPLSSAHHLHLARILASSDPGKAIDHAREAVRIYPSKPQTHLVLGDLLAHTGEKRAAAEEYKEALRLNDIVREPWLKIPEDQITRIQTFLSPF